MSGLTSARGRAALASALLVLALVIVAIVTVFRIRQHQEQLLALEDTAASVATLEHARAQLFLELAGLSGLMFSDDPALLADYQEAAAGLEQDLSQARAEAVAAGKADHVVALDDLTERIGSFNQTVSVAMLVLAQGEPETKVQLVGAAIPEMWAEIDAIVASLDQLAVAGQADLAAERATANDAAAYTSWLIVGVGGMALLLATAMVIVTIGSVVGSLISLRATARAITSGNLESRAKVSGPEEAASVARAFNEMTDALAAKTKEYIDTTNLTGDMIIRLDKDSRFTFFNDSACEILGKPREELLGTHAGTVVLPDDLERVAAVVREVIESKELVRAFESRIVTPMGIRVLEWNGCPLFDEQGEYAGIQITGRDITDRKRAERALAAKTEEYIATANLTVDIIIKTDRDGRWTFVNAAACQFFGKPREELLTAKFPDYVHPDDVALTTQAIRDGIAKREIVRGFVNRQVTPMGTRVVEWNGWPFFDEEGRYAGIQVTGRDISERKQMEEALREGEARYRLLAENTSDLIWTMDLSLRYTYMSPAVERMRGYTVEEVVDTTVAETMTPASLEVARKTLAEELALERMGGADPHRSRTLELEMYCKDGSTIWTEMNMTFLRDPDGRPVGILGVTRDISERKRADEALRESEERYRLITENVSDVIWTADLDRRYTYVSSSVTAMRGYTPEELIGTKQGDVAPAASNDIGDKFFAEDLAGLSKRANRPLRPRTFEVELDCKDGSTIWAEVKAIFIRDSNGRPIGIQGVTRDITERKKAEEALRESEERYRLITENVSDVIWTADLDRRYTYVSPSVTAMRGYTPEELIGTKQGDVVSAAYNDLFEKVLAKDLTGLSKRANRPLRPRTFEVELDCKDDSTIWAEVKAILICDSDGRPIGIQGVTRDITERKRMEQALAAKTREYVDTTNLTGDIIARLDKHGNWSFLNDAACRFYGKPREELLGTDSRAFVHPEDLEATAQQIRQTRVGKGLHKGFVNRQITPMGTRVVEWDGYPLFDDEGQYAGIQITGRDISERKQMEEALRENEERYRLLTENVSDLIWTMDLGLRYTYMSPAIKRMRGYTPEEIMDAPITETMTPASVEVARKALAEQLAIEREGNADPNRVTKVELEMYCKDGSTIWTEMNMTWLRDPDGKPVGILGVTRDISERKRAEEEREKLLAELELRAITDSLTGLYDHAHFYRRLAEEIDRSERYNHGFALLLMDIDDFKRFNDSRGHKVGDEMLRLVAHCIPAGLRRSDLAFRYGGDEFAAILPHADASKARAAVDRINRRIIKRLKEMDGDAENHLTLTAGVACFPDDGTTADELVRIADATLYNAKWVARARDIMGQKEDIQSLVSALVSRQSGAEGSADEASFRPEALHEQQARIVSGVASSIAVALKDAGVAQALEDPDLQVLATVGAAAEIKDRFIRGHPERMSEWAVPLSEEMGLPPERVRDIRIAALLHDIGKVTVSEGILNKPGKLTRREFESVKDHPIVGATLVSQVKGFERLAKIVRHHHERFDGSGYPDGLAGEDIPLESRILSVLDVFDALTHQRSYRNAQSKKEALAEIERAAGTQFDPAVVKPFLALVRKGGDGLRVSSEAASEDGRLAVAKAEGWRKR